MSRVQLALNVDDLDESIDFYRKLFNTEPAKVQPGYANFAVAEPPLKLILMENPGQGGSHQPPRRRGRRRRHRRRRADPPRRRGLRLDRRARHHLLLRQAGQVLGRGRPNGERWEVYTVLADSETFSAEQPEGTTCGKAAAKKS